MIRCFIIGLLLFVLSTSAAFANNQLRIVALAPHIVENLFAIGAGENIVGTVDYADYPLDAKKIARIGGYYGISIEKLLALKPDIVIAWQGGNQAEDLAQVKRLGIKVYLSDPKHIEGVADELRAFGKLTGYKQQAEDVAHQFDMKLATIRAKQQGKKVINGFYQLWPEPMMTVSHNTWISQLIEICKVNNVFANSASDYPQISIENVLVAKPDIIIVPDEKSNHPPPTVNWQQWPEIPAVKYQQFISVNADILHRFTPRMLDGLAYMCEQVDVSREIFKSQL